MELLQKLQKIKIMNAEQIHKENGLDLQMTCGACPEQYDVFKDGKIVGYYRLRHGLFTVDYPDCGAETIYEAEPKGDGIFEADERVMYLTNAMNAILDKLK